MSTDKEERKVASKADVIGEQGLHAWLSHSEALPALNISGETDEEHTYGVELYVRAGAIVGINITEGTSGIVAQFGLVPADKG